MPYYGVSVGKVPGVYTSWAACKEQVHQFKGAKYKRFGNRFAAKRFADGAECLPKMKQLTLDAGLSQKFDFTPSQRDVIEATRREYLQALKLAGPANHTVFKTMHFGSAPNWQNGQGLPPSIGSTAALRAGFS